MNAFKNDPQGVRQFLRERDGDSCALCGKPMCFTVPPGSQRGVSVDHKRPRAAGGTDALYNLQLAHTTCNHLKGSKHEDGDPGRQPSPYGIGKKYRQKSKRRYGNGPPCDGSDWDTPVHACWLPLKEFESWSAAKAP